MGDERCRRNSGRQWFSGTVATSPVMCTSEAGPAFRSQPSTRAPSDLGVSSESYRTATHASEDRPRQRRWWRAGELLPTRDEILRVHSDIARDLPGETRGDIATLVEWNRRRSAVWMPKLLVRSALSNFREAKCKQDRNDLARLQNRDVTHYATRTVCVPTNSDCSIGSPSSSSIAMTSSRFARNSSSVAPCECAPGQPGM